jgi:excisionase family DNA binding protein
VGCRRTERGKSSIAQEDTTRATEPRRPPLSLRGATYPGPEMNSTGNGNPLSDLARLLPSALDDDALRELASRLLPYLEQRQVSEQSVRLLTASEAAEHARVNVETVRRAIRAGDLLVAARIGRSPRIAPLALDRWLAESSNSTQGPPAHRRRRSARSGPAHELSLRAAFMKDD